MKKSTAWGSVLVLLALPLLLAGQPGPKASGPAKLLQLFETGQWVTLQEREGGKLSIRLVDADDKLVEETRAKEQHARYQEDMEKITALQERLRGVQGEIQSGKSQEALNKLIKESTDLRRQMNEMRPSYSRPVPYFEVFHIGEDVIGLRGERSETFLSALHISRVTRMMEDREP